MFFSLLNRITFVSSIMDYSLTPFQYTSPFTTWGNQQMTPFGTDLTGRSFFDQPLTNFVNQNVGFTRHPEDLTKIRALQPILNCDIVEGNTNQYLYLYLLFQCNELINFNLINYLLLLTTN